MYNLHAFLYNCDPQNTLGGSCHRDITNIAEFLQCMATKTYKEDTVLKSVNLYTKLNQNHSCFSDMFTDFMTSEGIEEGDVILVYLSGHGYQTRDLNGDEKDGNDEYIMTKFGRVLDDNIHDMLIKYLPKYTKFIGISDTCHSGTMFDFDKQVKVDVLQKYTCLSVSACADKELENCDIGMQVGFGGALTIQLLENKIEGICLLEYLVKNFDDAKCVLNVKDALYKKLSVFGQHPIINCQ